MHVINAMCCVLLVSVALSTLKKSYTSKYSNFNQSFILQNELKSPVLESRSPVQFIIISAVASLQKRPNNLGMC